jgi:hypothetical protein
MRHVAPAPMHDMMRTLTVLPIACDAANECRQHAWEEIEYARNARLAHDLVSATHALALARGWRIRSQRWVAYARERVASDPGLMS